ncbi:MAG: disulfide bond formation protein B [Holosporales bacterium]|jgi:disulfide bond formation protein DsbB|nr:disulfide bond formation protein B [Holosporales bacterium]
MQLTPVFKLGNAHLVIFVFSVLIVSSSVFSEIALHKTPCQLCLISRYIYIVVAISSGIAAKFEKIKTAPLIFIALALIFTFYHLGVENHWWHGPQSCTSELPTLSNVMEHVFTDNEKVHCDKVNWKIFGLSSTLLAFLCSAFLFWYNSVSYILFANSREEHGKK